MRSVLACKLTRNEGLLRGDYDICCLLYDDLSRAEHWVWLFLFSVAAAAAAAAAAAVVVVGGGGGGVWHQDHKRVRFFLHESKHEAPLVVA